MSSSQIGPARSEPSSLMMWRHIIAGFSASLIGVGLARFAYSPLIPSLINAHWFSANGVVYLGAANLAGYLLGAVIGRPMATRLSNVGILRSMKIMVTLSLLGCAFPLSLSWFFVWRLLSGVGGGAIMVLVAATVLPHMPAHRRGIASGAVFLGIGAGIAASGTLVPFLLQFGLRTTWIGLATLSAILTALSWTGWPHGDQLPQAQASVPTKERDPETAARRAKLVLAVYALAAVGLVAPMLFLADFIARGLNAGERMGSFFWVIYGLGAIIGPPAYGYVTDRLGARRAVHLLLGLQALALAGLAMSRTFAVLGLFTFIVGSFPPGIVPMTLGWIREIYPTDTVRQDIVWSRAIIVFAAFQALAAYAYSAVFSHSGGDYALLFEISSAAIVLAFLPDLLVPLVRSRKAAAAR